MALQPPGHPARAFVVDFAEMLFSVPKPKKTIMGLREKIPVLDKLC